VFLFAATVNRHTFADDISVADNHLRIAARVTYVLRFAADDNIWINDVVAADRDVSHDGHVVQNARAARYANMRADDRERSDFDIITDLGRRSDVGVFRNMGRHPRSLRIATKVRLDIDG